MTTPPCRGGIPPGSSYKDYILGAGPDRLVKTPEWAAAITGISAGRIVRLAREIGTAKPAYIAQGWGPQRQANGEQTARAICMLPILTGNVGYKGGQQRGPRTALWHPLSRHAHGREPGQGLHTLLFVDQGHR